MSELAVKRGDFLVGGGETKWKVANNEVEEVREVEEVGRRVEVKES